MTGLGQQHLPPVSTSILSHQHKAFNWGGVTNSVGAYLHFDVVVLPALLHLLLELLQGRREAENEREVAREQFLPTAAGVSCRDRADGGSFADARLPSR